MPPPAKIKKVEDVFEELIKSMKAPVEFDLPSALKEWKLGYYIPIKRNVYLTKRRVEDDGIFCSCTPSSGSLVACDKDCQCGMLFSCCSSNCKCDNQCANKSFQHRPLKKTKLITAKATDKKAATGPSGSGHQGKRPHQWTGFTDYTSGNLGVRSPSLSDIEKQRPPKKPKSTKVPAKKGQKLTEQSVKSSPRESAFVELTTLVHVADILADIQGTTSTALPPLDPTPPVTVASPPAASSNPANLLGFTLDDLDDPEIMATDDYAVDIKKILEVSLGASTAVVTSTPDMQERLNRLFYELIQPEAKLLANTQPLRDAMAAVEADLSPEAIKALLDVRHLDDQRVEVEAARARIAQQEAQQADQRLLDELVAKAKAMKTKFDQGASALKSTKANIQKLKSAKKLLEELTKLQKQLADGQAQLVASTTSLAAQKQEIGQAVAKVKEQSAKIVPVPGNAKADQRIVDGVQETMAKAAAALSALGARLPGFGL